MSISETRDTACFVCGALQRGIIASTSSITLHQERVDLANGAVWTCFLIIVFQALFAAVWVSRVVFQNTSFSQAFLRLFLLTKFKPPAVAYHRQRNQDDAQP